MLFPESSYDAKSESGLSYKMLLVQVNPRFDDFAETPSVKDLPTKTTSLDEVHVEPKKMSEEDVASTRIHSPRSIYAVGMDVGRMDGCELGTVVGWVDGCAVGSPDG
jgi:hypothetical protein